MMKDNERAKPNRQAQHDAVLLRPVSVRAESSKTSRAVYLSIPARIKMNHHHGKPTNKDLKPL